ncbi:hypothetical protein BKA70DRAFT_1532079 [Coprinopsis sp. MPI-PUGE-AT-0042]|nr:hypothetical protein BKA70DRAFT_1532079 [Coprinopsis sp. MPI-PUGE-AT-0042]
MKPPLRRTTILHRLGVLLVLFNLILDDQRRLRPSLTNQSLSQVEVEPFPPPKLLPEVEQRKSEVADLTNILQAMTTVPSFTPNGQLFVHSPQPVAPILLLRDLRNEDQFTASGRRFIWSSCSSQQTLVNPRSQHYDHGQPREHPKPVDDPSYYADIATLARAQPSHMAKSRLKFLPPEHIGDIMARHGSVLTAYHVAFELHKMTSRVLSQMSQQRDEYFGEAVWIIQHLNDLSEAQRLAAERAMGDWNNVYLREWGGVVEQLLSADSC